MYTCVAGQAHEYFLLHVIGSKQKLLAESTLRPGGQRKVGEPDAASTGERSQEPPVSINRYDVVVERLLELKRSAQEDVVDKPASDKNKSSPEDERASSDVSVSAVLIVDAHRLDEINQAEGPRAEQLMAQLLSELAATPDQTNESTLRHAQSSARGPQYKPNIITHTAGARSPPSVQRLRKVSAAASSEMVVHVGAPLLLQKPVASVEMRCESPGRPEPSRTWTKNGKELQLNSR